MSKRQAAEPTDGQPLNKASTSGEKRVVNKDNDEMGEFEDVYEDENESDEEVVDAEVTGEDG